MPNPTLTLVPCDTPRDSEGRYNYVSVLSDNGIQVAIVDFDTFWTGAGRNAVYDHLDEGRTIEVELSYVPESART